MSLSGGEIHPFQVHVPAAVIERIRDRVSGFRWEAWTEPNDADDWRYGPPAAFMRELCAY